MPLRYLTIWIFLIGLSHIYSANAQGGNDEPNQEPLFKPQVVDPVLFTVILADNCRTQLQFVDVFFDGKTLTRLMPGTRHEFEVELGNHSLQAVADGGGTFGPIDRYIDQAGMSQTLNCSSAAPAAEEPPLPDIDGFVGVFVTDKSKRVEWRTYYAIEQRDVDVVGSAPSPDELGVDLKSRACTNELYAGIQFRKNSPQPDHKLRVMWVRPDGEIAFDETVSSDPDSYTLSTSYYRGDNDGVPQTFFSQFFLRESSGDIFDFLAVQDEGVIEAENIHGTWQAQLFYNNELIAELPFELVCQ